MWVPSVGMPCCHHLSSPRPMVDCPLLLSPPQINLNTPPFAPPPLGGQTNGVAMAGTRPRLHWSTPLILPRPNLRNIFAPKWQKWWVQGPAPGPSGATCPPSPRPRRTTSPPGSPPGANQGLALRPIYSPNGQIVLKNSRGADLQSPVCPEDD